MTRCCTEKYLRLSMKYEKFRMHFERIKTNIIFNFLNIPL